MRRPTGRRSGDPSLRRYAPVIVLGIIVLAIGTAIIAGLLTPRETPRIVARQGAEVGSQAGGQQGLPSDHPPLEIPAQVREAIADLQKKAEESPDDMRAWSHLAEILYRAGQIERSYLESADAAFQRVLGLDPNNPDALRGRGSIAYERNLPKDAIGHYERYLELAPDDLAVQTDLGTMLLADGQVEQAVRTYDAVLKKDPNFFQALFNLAIAYRTAGQDEASIAMLEKARDSAPDDDTRLQIEQVIARAQQPAGDVPAPAADVDRGASFRAAIESMVRTHQILASKVQRFDWADDTNVQLVLTGFPMAQMPESMRDLFVTRMQERIAKAKAVHGITEAVTIELVDFESGEQMHTLVQ